MGQARNIPEDTIGTGGRLFRTWEDRYFRSVHRWMFFTGKKRGLAVGKTKRGKGTKIIAIADAYDETPFMLDAVISSS